MITTRGVISEVDQIQLSCRPELNYCTQNTTQGEERHKVQNLDLNS